MLSLIGLSLQAAYAVLHGPAALSDHRVFVPDSSIPKWYEAGLAAHTHHLISIGPQENPQPIYPTEFALNGPLAAATPSGYSPSQIRSAYAVVGAGSKAIAIVDAYNYPTALNDFNVFSAQYGLPQETSTSVTASTNKVFQVVYQGTKKPSNNASWNEEEALDIEWAHALAPSAKIYLVEANSASYANLFAAIQKAATLTGVSEVSNSWGGSEFSGETSYDSYFTTSGIVFFASAGDTGGAQEYPSESPNVVAAGGTTLNLSGTTVTSETAWSGSGGGPSSYEARPSYQSGISSIVGSVRGAPDLAADADPNTGVAVYDSTSYAGYVGWLVFGGTSVASPVLAGITNAAGTFRASSNAELTAIYSKLGTSSFRDITSGSAGSFTAKVGWDFITGVGAPVGASGL